MFIHISTGGQYALTVGSFDQRYSNLLGINILIVSLLIPFCHVNEDYKKHIWFSILIIILSFAILKIHFRMLSALILICLLINFEMRGFKIKFIHFLFLIIIFFIITLQSLFRVQHFNFSNSNALIFGILGEFFLSQIYFVAALLNPYQYELHFINYFDFILQLLPSVIRPVSAIDDFRTFNLQFGLDAAPIGGISIIGQSILYLKYFFPLLLWLVALYLLFCQKLIKQRTPHIILAGLPISLMILPRNYIWLLRNFLIAILIIFILKLIFNTLLKYKLLNFKSHS